MSSSGEKLMQVKGIKSNGQQLKRRGQSCLLGHFNRDPNRVKGGIWRKDAAGRGNSKCKGPEAGVYLACW